MGLPLHIIIVRVKYTPDGGGYPISLTLQYPVPSTHALYAACLQIKKTSVHNTTSSSSLYMNYN